MADLEYWDGFDNYTTTTGQGVDVFWTNEPNRGSHGYGPGRFSGQALVCGMTGGPGTGIARTMNDPTEYFSLAMSFKSNRFQGQNAINMAVGDNDNPNSCHCGISINPDGSINIVRGNGLNLGGGFETVLICTIPGINIPADTWHHLAIWGRVHSTEGFIRVAYDGYEVDYGGATVDNINTRFGGDGKARGVWFGMWDPYFSFTAITLDDVLMATSAFQIPEARVQKLQITADTAEKDWTASTGINNYACIDELPHDTADYVSGSTVGDVDEYVLADLDFIPTIIYSVGVRTLVDKSDSEARKLKFGVNSGGTVGMSDDIALTSTPLGKFKGYIKDPKTNDIWTAAGLNALKLRIEVTG